MKNDKRIRIRLSNFNASYGLTAIREGLALKDESGNIIGQCVEIKDGYAYFELFSNAPDDIFELQPAAISFDLAKSEVN